MHRAMLSVAAFAFVFAGMKKWLEQVFAFHASFVFASRKMLSLHE